MFFYGVVCADVASAFTLLQGPSNQTTVGWKTNHVSFDIDTSCNPYLSTVKDAINSAIGIWDSVPTSALRISIGNTVTLPHPITTYLGSSATSYAPVGNPIVYCDPNFTANSGADANSIPGFAASQNMITDGQLTGVLLVLNFQNGARANVGTLDSTLAHVVLAHEIGHCLGLGHSADKNALMYYSSSAANQLVLAKDDIDGITYLYPRQELLTGGFLGCNSTQTIASSRRGSNPSRQAGPDSGCVELSLLGLTSAMILYLRRRVNPCSAIGLN